MRQSLPLRTLSLLLALVLALTLLPACGRPSPAPSAATTEVAPEAAETPRVATAADMTEVQSVLEEGMTPLYADSLLDGTYPVVMESSSSMFKPENCLLTVDDGQLSVRLDMRSDSYAWLYPGTALEADAAVESDWLAPTPREGGGCSFTLPISALDAEVPCAAFSRKKELWYDRTLLFRSDSLPLEAFVPGLYPTVQSLGLSDGRYSVDVSLAGGSGRASVQSPALLVVQDGAATVELVWSSDKYDYMKLDGVQYLPMSVEGGSRFVLPAAVFDRAIPVLADTTAMSEPHEIAYTLRFSSASVQAAP